MPKTYHVVLIFPDGRQESLEVPDTQFILDAAMNVDLTLPYTCLQGWCITCAGRVLNGSADCYVDNRAALRYYRVDVEAGFVLLCTARPLQDCQIIVHQSQAMKNHRLQHGLPAPQG